MSPDLQQKLIDKYPKLFSNPSFWGFECGDGWYDLIDHLCYGITTYGNHEDVVVDQIKEKFGHLRFYTNYSDERIDGMIWLAEHMSGHICEVCGNRGEKRNGGWIRTLCDEHYKKES